MPLVEDDRIARAFQDHPQQLFYINRCNRFKLKDKKTTEVKRVIV